MYPFFYSRTFQYFVRHLPLRQSCIPRPALSTNILRPSEISTWDWPFSLPPAPSRILYGRALTNCPPLGAEDRPWCGLERKRQTGPLGFNHWPFWSGLRGSVTKISFPTARKDTAPRSSEHLHTMHESAASAFKSSIAHMAAVATVRDIMWTWYSLNNYYWTTVESIHQGNESTLRP